MIETTPEKIWELMPADRISDWMPYMAKDKRKEYITPIDNQSDKYKAGTIMHFDGTCQWKVVESVENKMMKYYLSEKSFLGRLGGWVTFSIEPVEGGCRFTYRTDFDIPNRFVEKLVGNYFTLKWFEKQLRTNMELLKSILESER